MPQNRIVASNNKAYAVYDIAPVSPAHCLIIPVRHAPRLEEINIDEWQAIGALLQNMREQIEKERRPNGFNIGINDGAAAGQTVGHLHVHLIPRYNGDCADPVGGIRRIFPQHDWRK